MDNRRRKPSLTKYFPLTLLQGFERGIQGLRVRGSCNILTPKLMAVNVGSFSFFWCSTGALGSTLLGAGFLYCILSASSLDLNSSGLLVAFLTTSHSNWHLNSTVTGNQLAATQLSYIIFRRPLDLWNPMFNCHQGEITVMQFRGHALPVRQSLRVSWDFLARPISLVNFHPRDFLSQLPLECVTSFLCITLNGIWARSRVKTQHYYFVSEWTLE